MKQAVTFSNNRVLITLCLHCVFGAMSSFAPEENWGYWIRVQILMAIVFGFINYILWMIYKNDSKRYCSLHTFVMLLGIAYYMMTPAFRGLFPSIFFWLVLLITIALIGFLLLKNDAVANAFVNPGDSWFFKILCIMGASILVAGGLLWAHMNITETGQFTPVAIILFLIGFLLVMIAPLMLATPERIKELEKPRY